MRRLDRKPPQHHRAVTRSRAAGAGQRPFDDRRVSLGDPARGIDEDGTDREGQQLFEQAGLVARPGQVNDVGHLVRHEKLHPLAIVADVRFGFRRRGPEDDDRPIQERKRHPVRLGRRVLDEDIDRPGRTIADEVGHPLVDPFDGGSGVRGPRLEGRGKVDAKVFRLDRAPGG